MKTHQTIILLCLLTFAPVKAQTACQAIFSSEKPCFQQADRVLVESGKELRKYGLTRYECIVVRKNAEATQLMEKAAEGDARFSTQRELSHIGGRLYQAYFCMPRAKSSYSYIFFRNASLRAGGKDETTLIWMEGNVKMDELRQMFKK